MGFYLRISWLHLHCLLWKVKLTEATSHPQRCQGMASTLRSCPEGSRLDYSVANLIDMNANVWYIEMKSSWLLLARGELRAIKGNAVGALLMIGGVLSTRNSETCDGVASEG